MHRRTFLTTLAAASAAPPLLAGEDDRAAAWRAVAPYFRPPERLAGDPGSFRSPLRFDDGRPVRDAADWQRRRAEILSYWHGVMGPWPKVLREPRLEVLGGEEVTKVRLQRVRLQITAERTTEAYLLLPPREGRRPAALVVYYDPETGIGRGRATLRDFALQLARRGFVTLSLGLPSSIYLPEEERVTVQPLSGLAYVAANGYHALANLPQVDSRRVGVLGHSYGGKWAMFASCLYDRFACAAWSDGGVVFDERRSNVNYWEPWYLGWESGKKRKPGIPTPENPRTGAYKRLVAEGRDLHELHALMAPRPFLVSGGAEDQPERWAALNHAVAVNRLLGHEHRVAMTNRPAHSPTEESNEQIYAFFEWALKD